MLDLMGKPKIMRAQIIAAHLSDARLPQRVVCCTCGNAAAQLRRFGLDVVEIGPQGVLQPSRWLLPYELARIFPGHFDATSGHLSVHMMGQLGQRLRASLGDVPPDTEVASGSGETAVALALAYPGIRFTAVYGGSPATEWHEQAPLNGLVAQLCSVRRT